MRVKKFWGNVQHVKDIIGEMGTYFEECIHMSIPEKQSNYIVTHIAVNIKEWVRIKVHSLTYF